MSQAYYIVVNSRDLPCDKDGKSSDGMMIGCFPGAYAYESRGLAERAASKFTLSTKESHGIFKIYGRFVYTCKTEFQAFDG